MSGLFPWFFYDVLARIIPGAFTMAVILKLVPDEVAWRWKNIFIFVGDENWKTVVSPLVLGGLSYMIGLVYEVANSWPPLRRVREFLDNKAFGAAWHKFSKSCKRCTERTLENLKLLKSERRSRNQLWERLVCESARKSEMVSVFWHCHRFQAEYKMFYHLMYPTLFLLAGLSFYRGHFWTGILAIGVTLVFFYCAYRRDERRWWQVLSFAEQLEWLKDYYD